MSGERTGQDLVLAYRDLPDAEARLGETLSQRGVRVGVSVIDQWPVLQEYLDLYARGLSPAGALVLAGGPDEGSRATGIPFTGPAEAREALGLGATGDARSPGGAAFWRAVSQAQRAVEGAPVDALFGTVHLAHARPFDLPATAREVRAASSAHVRRLLVSARPQAVVTVGAEALATLGDALGDARFLDLAGAPESSWMARWPAGSRLGAYPIADVPGPRPFRVRVVPVPSLEGPSAEGSVDAIAALLATVWA